MGWPASLTYCTTSPTPRRRSHQTQNALEVHVPPKRSRLLPRAISTRPRSWPSGSTSHRARSIRGETQAMDTNEDRDCLAVPTGGCGGMAVGEPGARRATHQALAGRVHPRANRVVSSGHLGGEEGCVVRRIPHRTQGRLELHGARCVPCLQRRRSYQPGWRIAKAPSLEVDLTCPRPRRRPLSFVGPLPGRPATSR
jgi:hypothetical protein